MPVYQRVNLLGSAHESCRVKAARTGEANDDGVVSTVLRANEVIE